MRQNIQQWTKQNFWRQPLKYLKWFGLFKSTMSVQIFERVISTKVICSIHGHFFMLSFCLLALIVWINILFLISIISCNTDYTDNFGCVVYRSSYLIWECSKKSWKIHGKKLCQRLFSSKKCNQKLKFLKLLRSNSE